MSKYYEVVFLIHPDRSNQVDSMIDRYRTLITKNGGTIHRLENWGRRHLAYPIAKVHKAHYILMNIECEPKILEELRSMFRFNDAVLRNLITQTDEISKESSVIMRNENKEKSNQDFTKNNTRKHADMIQSDNLNSTGGDENG